jgi:putative ABC transport system permease protein
MFRHAFRSLVRRPAYTVLAVLTLAIGIGANTAIFSVVNGVLLRPLPYPQPDRIVGLWEHTSRSPRVHVSYPNFRDWHDRLRSFESVSAYGTDTTTVLGGAQPTFADVCWVTKDFFDVFRVAPEMGRTFTADETTPAGPAAAIVSDRFWRRTLGATRDLTALHVATEGLNARIVGVMPAGFDFPSGTDVWIPQEHTPDDSGRTAHNYSVVARRGASFDQAEAELRIIAQQLRTEHPGDNDAESITMLPLQDALTRGSRTALLLLLAAVALVLLIACANVANTTIARGEERRAEIAVRAALGASRMRIARQLLVESVLLGAAGAAGGLVIGAWLLRAFLALNTVPLGGQTVALDAAVVAFTAALGMLTPMLFGIVPALQLSRPDLRSTIAESGRGSLVLARRTVRSVLIAIEAAVALVLLIASVLLIHSFWRLMSVDTGFDPRGVATMEMSVPETKYSTPEASARFYQQFLERVRAVPGVESAGLTNAPPMAGGGPSGTLTFEGSTAPDPSLIADYFVISPGYFDTLRIPIVRGRGIDAGDTSGKPVAVVVNQTFARKFLHDENPIGGRFRYLGMDSSKEPMMTIVGVAADVRSDALTAPIVPEAYVSYLQRPLRTKWGMVVTARARQGRADALLEPLQRTLTMLDSDVPVKLGTMDERIGDSVADRRFTMAVLSTFAVVAVLLAAIGIYSVLSQSVAQRKAEIGVRMALGADARIVLRLVVRTMMGPVLAGIALGLMTAAFAVKLLATFVFGVEPLDPVAFGLAAVLLLVVALAAAYLPARRATRVDPMLALRAS